MATTYDLIATTTIVTPTSSVTFSSIPATYTDLVLVLMLQTSATTNTRVVFNSDTATNYSYSGLGGNGTTASGARAGTLAYAQLDRLATPPTSVTFSSIVCNINGYLTAWQKLFLSRADSAGVGTDAVCGMWRGTAAINAITIKTAAAQTYSAGSTFSLYGIKAA